MKDEIESLQMEVNVLKERVNVLEKRERKRKAARLIGIMLKIIFYCSVLIGLWIGYQYVSNIPSMLSEKIKDANPINRIDLSNFSISDLFKKKDKDE